MRRDEILEVKFRRKAKNEGERTTFINPSVLLLTEALSGHVFLQCFPPFYRDNKLISFLLILLSWGKLRGVVVYEHSTAEDFRTCWSYRLFRSFKIKVTKKSYLPGRRWSSQAWLLISQQTQRESQPVVRGQIEDGVHVTQPKNKQ